MRSQPLSHKRGSREAHLSSRLTGTLPLSHKGRGGEPYLSSPLTGTLPLSPCGRGGWGVRAYPPTILKNRRLPTCSTYSPSGATCESTPGTTLFVDVCTKAECDEGGCLLGPDAADCRRHGACVGRPEVTIVTSRQLQAKHLLRGCCLEALRVHISRPPELGADSRAEHTSSDTLIKCGSLWHSPPYLRIHLGLGDHPIYDQLAEFGRQTGEVGAEAGDPHNQVWILAWVLVRLEKLGNIHQIHVDLGPAQPEV